MPYAHTYTCTHSGGARTSCMVSHMTITWPSHDHHHWLYVVQLICSYLTHWDLVLHMMDIWTNQIQGHLPNSRHTVHMPIYLYSYTGVHSVCVAPVNYQPGGSPIDTEWQLLITTNMQGQTCMATTQKTCGMCESVCMWALGNWWGLKLRMRTEYYKA